MPIILSKPPAFLLPCRVLSKSNCVFPTTGFCACSYCLRNPLL